MLVRAHKALSNNEDNVNVKTRRKVGAFLLLLHCTGLTWLQLNLGIWERVRKGLFFLFLVLLLLSYFVAYNKIGEEAEQTGGVIEWEKEGEKSCCE